MKDTSLRVPSSVRGTVIDAKVYTREGVELDSRSRSIIDHETTLFKEMRKLRLMQLKILL